MHPLLGTLLASESTVGAVEPGMYPHADRAHRSPADPRLRLHRAVRAPAAGEGGQDRGRDRAGGHRHRGLGDRHDGRRPGAHPCGTLRRARPGRQALDVDPRRGLLGGPRVPRGRPDRRAPDRRHDDRHARAHLLDRVHGARPGHVAVLRLSQPVHVLDARAGAGGQLGAGVRGLGAGGPVLLLADRVLVPEAVRGAGRQEGVHRQPRRRRRVRARDHGDLGQHRNAQHPGVAGEADRDAGRRVDDPAGGRRPAGVRGCDGQERPVPAPRLAPGRHGGPDAGLRPDPCRHDGQRRRLPGRARQPAVRPRAGGDGRRRRDRHLHRDPRGVDRVHPDRHQARARVLHALAAGLHVRRAGRGRLRRGDLPPDDPRLLQGPAVPRVGLGDPRRRWRAGHEPDGRAVAEDPDHALDDAHRHDRDRRHPAARGLLLQGRDPGRGVQVRVLLGLGDRPRGRGDDRVLHVAPDGQDVLRRVTGGPARGAEDPRVAVDHDPAAHPARDPGRAAGHRPGHAARRLHAQGLAGAGLHRVRGVPLRRAPRVRAVRDRRLPDPRQRRRRRPSGSSSGSGCSGPSGAGASRSASSSSPTPTGRRGSSTARRSTSGGSTSSTTCCSSASAGASPRSCGGSTGPSWTAPSTASAP